MICKKCGNEFSDGTLCPKCGAKMEQESNLEEQHTVKEASKLKGKSKKNKRLVNIVFWAVLIFGALIYLMSKGNDSVTSVTDSALEKESVSEKESPLEKESAPQADFLGVLGEDFSLSVFSDEPSGKQFVFTAVFWSTRNDSYGYEFTYKQKNDDGTLTGQSFKVKDATADKVLSALDDVSYEEQAVVKMTAVFDKTEIISYSKGTQITYYVTAEEAEILDKDSYAAEKATGNYYYIGDTVQLNNGITYTITDGGLYREYTKDFVFIELDVENQSGSDLTIYNSDVHFYADDYALTTGFPTMNDNNKFSGVTISDGRKGSGRLYAECSDYNNITRIEAEIGDIVIVIKDSGKLEGDLHTTGSQAENIPIEIEGERVEISNTVPYGTYLYDDGENVTCEAEVGFATDSGYDYISVDCWGYGGHEIIYFVGYLSLDGSGNYYAESEEYKGIIQIVPSENGFELKVIDTEIESLYMLEGSYELDNLLDLNEVG